jgi:hypothetical protein
MDSGARKVIPMDQYVGRVVKGSRSRRYPLPHRGGATGPFFSSIQVDGVYPSRFSISEAIVSGDAIAPVPEPGTLTIWTTFGGIGLIAARRRRKAA